jgi:uncharacterized protein
MRSIVILLTLALTTPSLAAGFDCRLAQVGVEKMICADAALSKLDDDVSSAYANALMQANSERGQIGIRMSQRQWLSGRDRCASRACIENAYSTRINQLRFDYPDFDCGKPYSEFVKLACAATDDASLRVAFDAKMQEWTPVANLRSYMPHDLSQAQQGLAAERDMLYGNFTKKCATFACRQAETARALQLNAFPSEAFHALLDYAQRKGSQTALLTSNAWRLPAAEVEPQLVVNDGRIEWLGDQPSWLSAGKPPFLPRGLEEWERHALGRLLTDGDLVDLSHPVRASVGFSDGGSAKCSRNPFSSSIDVSNAFPQAVNDGDFKSYKLVRLLPIAETFQRPSCEDNQPDGFFSTTRGDYRSNVEIDGLDNQPSSSGIFVRPDGTFWLHLSDDNWYRFRRDMTSDAPEIGTKYHVMPESAFDKLLSQAKTLSDLENALRKTLPANSAGKP